MSAPSSATIPDDKALEALVKLLSSANEGIILAAAQTVLDYKIKVKSYE